MPDIDRFRSITPISRGCTFPRRFSVSSLSDRADHTDRSDALRPRRQRRRYGPTRPGSRRRGGVQRVEAPADRAPAVDTRVRAPAPAEAARPGGLLHGRDRVDRLRDPGDPRRARAGRGDGGPRLPGADLALRRGAPGDRGRELPPDALRLPERRRRVHREPREPGHESGPGGGGVVAGRLHVDGLGVGRRRGRRDHLRHLAPPRLRGGARDRADHDHHAREPARCQGVRPSVRAADVPLPGDHDVARGLGAVPDLHRQPAAAAGRSEGARPLHRRRDDARRGHLLPLAAGVLLGSGGAERCRGDLQRDPGLPQTGVAQRRHHADVDGVLSRVVVRRDRRPRRSAAANALGEPDHPLDDGPRRVRRERPSLYRSAGGNCRDPDAVREHRLRRLPPPVRDHRPRRVPAPPARQSRRPARAVQRHLGPRLRSRGARRRLPRRRLRPRAALCRRAVHRIHALAGRHGHVPLAATRDRLATRPSGQRNRHGRDIARHRGDPGLEVHRGRLDPGPRDPLARLLVQGDPPALRDRRPRAQCRAGHQDPGDPAHGRGARRAEGAPRRHPGDRIREVLTTRLPARALCLVRPRTGRPAP